MEKEIKAFEKYLGRKLGLGNKALIESFIEFRALNSEVSEAHSERSEAYEKVCEKCGSSKIQMFTTDMDMCRDCKHSWYV